MIAIIDYKAGNILSVKNALERLGMDYFVTRDPQAFLDADGAIFPGQGRMGQAMSELQIMGMDQAIMSTKKPFLGICLGMQLLGGYSEEDTVRCLSIFDAKCRKLPPLVKVPHLGWNRVDLMQKSDLFNAVPDKSYFYFVHSYYLDGSGDDVVSTTEYGFEFSSAMQKENFYAIQFHPEKSGEIGLLLLNNFLKLC